MVGFEEMRDELLERIGSSKSHILFHLTRTLGP